MEVPPRQHNEGTTSICIGELVEAELLDEKWLPAGSVVGKMIDSGIPGPEGQEIFLYGLTGSTIDLRRWLGLEF